MVYFYLIAAFAVVVASFVAGALYGRKAALAAEAEKEVLKSSAVKFINKL